MSLNVPHDNVPCNKFPRDNVSRDNFPRDNVSRHNVSHDNCSLLQCPSQQCASRKLFLVKIFPRDNCSSIPLQIVICKEDSPRDDQNQGDEGAWIVANNHLDDIPSSVLLPFFANGHLQRERFSGWPKSRGRRSRNCCKMIRPPPFLCKWSGSSRWPTFFWSNGAEIRTRPAPSIDDP